MEPSERLRRRIERHGRIPFADFMEIALYGPGGYYARDELPIGGDGDYVTGSSLSPLFARATARLLAELDRSLGGVAGYLEAGYGSAVHLRHLIAELGGPDAGRPLLAWDRVSRPLPAPARRLEALERLRPGEVDGLVLSYELFDALPVHRLVARAGGLAELWVDLDDAGRFTWCEAELSEPSLARLVGAPLIEGQIADLAPGWRPLYRALAERLGAGLLVTFDYGFPAERLLDARVRRHGTLACYRSQRVHRDPFRDPGREDLTAHVDFSALIEEGEAAGLDTLAFTRQAPWLAACGLLEGLESADPATRIAAQQLLALDGMGEEIRVLVQGRGIDAAGFEPLVALAGG